MSAAPKPSQVEGTLSSSTSEQDDLAAVTPNPPTIPLSNPPDLVPDLPKPPTAGPAIKILARPPRTVVTAPPPSQPIASTSTAPPPPDATSAVPLLKDKKITLLRRPSGSRNASVGDSGVGGVGPGGARAPRAASEGRGGGAHSPASSEASFRRTDSEPVLTSLVSRNTSSPAATPPRSPSPSPEPSTSSLVPTEDGSMAGAAELDEGAEAELELDSALRAALLLPRDRFLLLRAEAEMERFLADSTMYRLPLSPPYFPPALNSYQRLLIHRLADTFGITREVDPIEPSVWAATASAASVMNVPTGIVVLVKGALTRLPNTKLATHVPAPTTIILTPTSSSFVDSSSSPSLSVAPSPPPSPSVPLPQPQFFKILPRTSHRPTSSASSSIGTDEDGKGKSRTLEEREAAYKEARERIFKQEAQAQEAGGASSGASIGRPSSAGSTYSRSSAMSLAGGRPSPSVASDGSSSIHSSFQGPSGGGTVYYPQPQSSQGQARAQAAAALRPSAPSFDPGAGGWGAYAYAAQGAEYRQQVDPYAQYAGAYAEAGYGGEGEWSRQQQPRQHLQPPPPPPPQQQQQQQQRHQPYDPRLGSQQRPPYAHSQPPIQVTAPSPLPQHANWASPPPPPSSQPSYQSQYPSYASPSPYAPPHPSTLDSFHPPPPAAYARQQPLPSPALSTSSGGSYHPPPAGSTSDRGYIMRFAEGGVMGVSGFPARSASSLSSASSSSTGRTASSSNGPGLGAVRGEQGGRRHEASGSLSSAVSTVSVTSERSEEGKVGKGKGKAEEGKSTLPLHPSLPAKPVWVTKQPPVERTTLPSPAATPNETHRIAASSSAPSSHSHTPPTQLQSPYQPYPAQDPTYPTPPAYPYSTTQLPTTITHQSFYPLPPSQPPPWWDSSNPELYHDPLVRPSSEEMRRPPPRSTELFDPSTGKMRRSESEKGRRVEELGAGVEGMRL